MVEENKKTIELLQAEAFIRKIQTLVDGGLKLEVITQEINPEDAVKLFELKGKKNIAHLAHFSVPPIVFKDIVKNLGESKKKTEDIRLIIEKPFGLDKKSATDLYHYIARYFQDEDIYLLDHYLGKSAVQSILHLRHANKILNSMMQGSEVANIQITAFEEEGVKTRVGYFDQVGIIKDMVESHLLQVLSLVAMSIPVTENEKSLHREKYAILSALNFISSKKNIVLGNMKGI